MFYCIEVPESMFFKEIHGYRNAYYAGMNEVPPQDTRDKNWVVCTNDEEDIVGCFSYAIIADFILVYDFYGSPKAIHTMEETINYLILEYKATLFFETNANNTAWTNALLKRGYKMKTIIWGKD